MPQEPAEDKDDVFIENLSTALFLLLGSLAVSASVILLGYSAMSFVYSRQFSLSLLTTPVFAVSLLVIGLCSVYLFRKRRKARKEKTSRVF